MATPICRLTCEQRQQCNLDDSLKPRTLRVTSVFCLRLPYYVVSASSCGVTRYDEGCTGITNVDFSKTVIKEMMLKNLRKRPLMKWLVMDMTNTKVSWPPFKRGVL